MSVRRTKVDGEAALMAQVAPNLWKVVYPNGKVSFFAPEAEARDYDPEQPRAAAGDPHGGQWIGGGGTGFAVYRGMEGLSINEALRAQQFSKLDSRLQKAVGDLDKEIRESSPLTADLKVYRGLDEDFDAREWVSGTKVLDRGFVSTTTEREVAAMFSGSGSIMEIDLPKGMRVLMVSPEYGQPIGGYEHQSEVLLPRGLNYEVVSKTKLKPGSFHIRLKPLVTIKDWNPFQRRVPKGEAGGGQWSGENLTDRERQEVRHYTTEAYRHINSTLREGLAYVLDRTVPLLDSAIAKSVIGKDFTVFRGINSNRFIARLESLQPGEEITDKAYTSASGSYLAANQYSGVGRPVMEISIPRGSNVLYAESMSVSIGLGEEEYILPRNSTFRYVEKVGSAGATRYRFDLVRKSAKDSYDPSEPRVPAGEPGGGQWRGENLSKEERTEIEHYTAEGYSTINERLRNGLPSIHAALIDSAIDKSVLTSDTVVYRGVSLTAFVDQLNTLKPGEEITDAAFVSTSGSLATAATFGRGSVMEIRLPAGSRALYVEGFSSGKGEEEDEYLLPRGTTFRYVTSRTTKTKKTVYTFDLAPRAATDWNPFQPRVPKGEHGGGEWTEGGSTGGGKLSFVGNKPVGLQATHTDALKQYTASVYYPVNKGLRDETPLSTQEQAVVKALDEAFDRAMKTTEVMQLFRAAGEEFADVVEKLKVGEDVTDKAFVSTTIDETYARTLMGGQSGDRKALIEIVLPKESRAIDTGPFNPFKGENETLLPRNTTFRYLGKERDVYRFRANPRPLAA